MNRSHYAALSNGLYLMIKQVELDFDDRWVDENHIPELQYVKGSALDDNGEHLFEGFWIGLPRDKEALLNLEELDLSWHSCTEIPDQIRHLTKLKVLRFAKKCDGTQPPFYKQADSPHTIEEIPDWIVKLENLEELWFDG
jgi:hypothetical protein